MEPDSLQSIQFVFSLIDYISVKGIKLVFGTDLAVFNKIVETRTDRHAPARIFVPDESGKDEADAFWMIGENDNGEVIHTQAVRLVDLAGDNLASYFGRNFEIVSSRDLSITHHFGNAVRFLA